MTKKRHGNELDPLYSRWLNMNQRCNNTTNSGYAAYGGRGITIAEDIRSFRDYKLYVESLPNCDPTKLSVDRIDNNKGYAKGNLRWAHKSTQTANQRFSGKGGNKYTGVNCSKSHDRWVARVTFQGKPLLVKTYLTEKEAYNSRKTFIIENNLPHTIQEWIG